MATTNLGRVGLVNQGVYSASETYSKNDFVSDGNNSLYFSLQDNNTGHALSESAWWFKFFDGTAANTAAAAQAATDAAAAAALVEQQVEGATPSLDVAENTLYLCGELTSLTLTSIPTSTKLSIIRFTSGDTATQFAYPEGTSITGWSQPQANTNYSLFIWEGAITMIYDE
ncbi:hypothetical protein [uncultured Alistipes sp.]|uniref:hypothetical protein n=1 Tax=uncultured Alistipes sp. TaxID=538949 RepID=UPI003208CD00